MTGEQTTKIKQFTEYFTAVDDIVRLIKRTDEYDYSSDFVADLKKTYNSGFKKCKLTSFEATISITDLYNEIDRLNQRIEDGLCTSSAQDELIKIRKLLEENLTKQTNQTEEL